MSEKPSKAALAAAFAAGKANADTEPRKRSGPDANPFDPYTHAAERDAWNEGFEEGDQE